MDEIKQAILAALLTIDDRQLFARSVRVLGKSLLNRIAQFQGPTTIEPAESVRFDRDLAEFFGLLPLVKLDPSTVKPVIDSEPETEQHWSDSTSSHSTVKPLVEDSSSDSEAEKVTFVEDRLALGH